MQSFESAIVLAAGFGKRLMPLTADRPKCIVSVGGKPIVVRTLEHLAREGVTRATLVLGHAARSVIDRLGDRCADIALDYVISDVYASTNTMYSLLLAQDVLRRGCYVIEGDGVLGREVVAAMTRAQPHERSLWAVDAWDEQITGCRLSTAPGETRIIAQTIVRSADPDFRPAEHFKSVGFLRLTAEQGSLLADKLAIESQANNRGVYYDDVFGKYVDEFDVHALNIHPHPWMEVDDHDDLARAQALFGPASTA